MTMKEREATWIVTESSLQLLFVSTAQGQRDRVFGCQGWDKKFEDHLPLLSGFPTGRAQEPPPWAHTRMCFKRCEYVRVFKVLVTVHLIRCFSVHENYIPTGAWIIKILRFLASATSLLSQFPLALGCQPLRLRSQACPTLHHQVGDGLLSSQPRPSEHDLGQSQHTLQGSELAGLRGGLDTG